MQVVGDVGKAYPGALNTLLAAAHPSLVVVTPAQLSPKMRKAGASSVLAALPFSGGTWQIVLTAQVGTFDIDSGASGWSTQADG